MSIEAFANALLSNSLVANQHLSEPWNGSLVSTAGARMVAQTLSDLTAVESGKSVPYVYRGYHAIDLYSFFCANSIVIPKCEWTQRVVPLFVQNKNDPRTNYGLSILLGTSIWNGFARSYQTLRLYQNVKVVRDMHHQFDYDFRLLSVNLQFCDSLSKLKKWMNIWKDSEADIVCVQEIDRKSVEKCEKLGAQIVHFQENSGTAVLSFLSCALPKEVWIRSVHLDDIPSPLHVLAGIPYEGNPDNVRHMSELIEKCWASRGNAIRELTAEADHHQHRAPFQILAGDFNEPSHLDPPQINWPVSRWMEQNGWVDLMGRTGMGIPFPTWPYAGFFPNEPIQRIDFIYLRGPWRVLYADRFVMSREQGWPSDHCGLICDLRR